MSGWRNGGGGLLSDQASSPKALSSAHPATVQTQCIERHWCRFPVELHTSDFPSVVKKHRKGTHTECFTHTFVHSITHSLTPSVFINGCIIVRETTGAIFGGQVGQRGGGTSLVSKVGGGGAFKQILNTDSQTHLLSVNRHLTMQHYKYTSGGRPSGKTE